MTNSPIFQKLADALRERLAVITNHELRDRDPQAQLAALQAASEKIDRIQSELPPEIDPMLRHFLKGCSYQKALAFLENQNH